jgi:hypothetical protein
MKTLGYDVTDANDDGLTSRAVWTEVDRVQDSGSAWSRPSTSLDTCVSPTRVGRVWPGSRGRGRQGRMTPPVTPRISPVTKLDSSLARKTKAGASSTG